MVLLFVYLLDNKDLVLKVLPLQKRVQVGQEGLQVAGAVPVRHQEGHPVRLGSAWDEVAAREERESGLGCRL